MAAITEYKYEQRREKRSSCGGVESKASREEGGKLRVVLDMDECILHSRFSSGESLKHRQFEPGLLSKNNSFVGIFGIYEGQSNLDCFSVVLNDGDVAHVALRPGLKEFLAKLASKYHITVYTAAVQSYANPVLDVIDPKGELFHQRFFRCSCRELNGAFLKDLSRAFGDDFEPTRCVLVDNNPLSFMCQPHNGILLTSWYNDSEDTALEAVFDLLENLEDLDDLRPSLKEAFRMEELLKTRWSHMYDLAQGLLGTNSEEGNELDDSQHAALPKLGLVVPANDNNCAVDDGESTESSTNDGTDESTNGADMW